MTPEDIAAARTDGRLSAAGAAAYAKGRRDEAANEREGVVLAERDADESRAARHCDLAAEATAAANLVADAIEMASAPDDAGLDWPQFIAGQPEVSPMTTDDRQALWQREDHVRAREAEIAEAMRDRLALLDGLPPALRGEFEQAFIVHSTYLEILQTNMEDSEQQAAILRQRVRHAPAARSAPPVLAPRTAPRQRGTGSRPAARRAAGPRSGTDPGDDAASHEPPPPPDAPRADGSDQHEGRNGEEANR